MHKLKFCLYSTYMNYIIMQTNICLHRWKELELLVMCNSFWDSELMNRICSCQLVCYFNVRHQHKAHLLRPVSWQVNVSKSFSRMDFDDTFCLQHSNIKWINVVRERNGSIRSFIKYDLQVNNRAAWTCVARVCLHVYLSERYEHPIFTLKVM